MNTTFAALFLAFLALGQEPGTNRVPIAPADARRAGEELRVYEVGDILEQLGSDYAAPELGVIEDPVPPDRAGSARKSIPTPEPTAAEIEARRAANARVLVEILRRDLQPPLGNADALRCVAQGTLIANLTPKQHDWLGGFLERLRKFDGYIEVEIRLVEGAAGAMKKWGLDESGRLRDRAALHALEKHIKETPGFNLISAPRLMVLPLQRASLSTLDGVSFVRDWSVEVVEPNQAEIAVPRIGVIHEGVAVDVRAIPLDEDAVRLDLRLQNCKVKRPIRTSSVPLGRDKYMVEIALPEADVARQEASVGIESGASIALVTPGMDKSTEQVLILTTKRVPRDRR